MRPTFRDIMACMRQTETGIRRQMQGTRDRVVHVLPPRGRFELMGERPNAALWRDKFVQKQHFSAAAVPLGPFRSVASVSDACAAAREYVPSSLSVAVRARWHLSCCEYLGVGRSACIAPRTAHTSLPCERPGKTPRGRVVHRCGRFGYPLMLKARKLSYDGKGNAVVRSDAEMQVRPLCPLLKRTASFAVAAFVRRDAVEQRATCLIQDDMQHAAYSMTCNMHHATVQYAPPKLRHATCNV